MNNMPVLDAIDPEIIDRLTERHTEIAQGSPAPSGITAALAMGSIPIALAALSHNVYAQGGLPAAIKNVLDFALALEIFENEFYKAVLGTSASTAQNAAFAPVRALAAAVPGAVPTLQQIQKHETAHVATLTATGATNVFNLDATSFDFTGARGAGGGPFSKATTDLAFLLEVAQGAEDTGVRAYKGQAGNLISNSAILEAALRIHSVEARHASRIRRMRRAAAGAPAVVRYSGTVRGGERAAAGGTDLGTVNPTAVGAAFDKIYGAGANSTTAPSESNTTQAGVNVANLAGAQFGIEAAQEAFDEPLDRADVIAIVQPFFIPTVS
ncbi:MAG TPA: ferritin-like domain-containing protein [Gemmatimonadaceae bacterium]|nr:ferritin-like domain-containing protein [Gemmatimonadaceae bacterium]